MVKRKGTLADVIRSVLQRIFLATLLVRLVLLTDTLYSTTIVLSIHLRKKWGVLDVMNEPLSPF